MVLLEIHFMFLVSTTASEEITLQREKHHQQPLSWPIDASFSSLSRLAPPHQHKTFKNLHQKATLLLRTNNKREGKCKSGGGKYCRDRKASTVGRISTTGATSPLIRVASYPGADPYGRKDSTLAFKACMADALTRGTNARLMGDNVTDLGGVVIDLEGGDYLISEPIHIPTLYGNLRFQRGTIRASASFPASSYLIEVGEELCSEGGQACCNEHIGFENMMLDASLIALGGLRINNTMDTVVGPHMLFVGFLEAGLTINGGHESTVSHCWFGQYYYDDPRWVNSTGKGIWLAGPDSIITQVKAIMQASLHLHFMLFLPSQL